MTIVGIFLIIIFVSLIIRGLLEPEKKEFLTNLKANLSSKSSISNYLFFFTTFFSVILIADQVIGLVLIISIVWLLFYRELKNKGYALLAWWTLITFLIYLYVEYSNFENVELTQPWYLTILIWSFAFILLLIFEAFGKIHKLIPILINSFLSLAIVYFAIIPIVYQATFENHFGENQVLAILQSTVSESNEYITQYISGSTLFYVLLTLLITMGLIIFQGLSSSTKIGFKQFMKITVFTLLLVNLDVVKHLQITNSVIENVEKYWKELVEFRKELEKRKAGDINFTATKVEKNEISIVIIGESHNKNHMGLYGYHRNTTPLLSQLESKNELIRFNQAFANYVHTVQALTFSLTEANQLNGQEFNKSLSILDIQDQAGFETYWVSNQVAKGGWDNPVSVLAERADHRFNFNTNIGLNTTTSNYDGDMLPKIQQILDERNQDDNTVIYVHLIGNHGGYGERYPEEFAKFKGEFKTKNFGNEKYWAEHINEYDNSVLYNDFIVYSIIEMAASKGGVSSVVYFADHSEDVLHNNGHDHANFTFPMIEIPFLVWLSSDYQNQYPNKTKHLKKNTDQLFSNGFLYDFLIGLTNIKTDHYQAHFDLTNQDYFLPISKSSTLHNKIQLSNPNNYTYYERLNVKKIDSLNQAKRVIPHRVNSIGKLSNVLFTGCRSFELDAVVHENGDSTYFEVGHDDAVMSGMSLEELLTFSSKYPVKKIWLDFKNINSQNIDLVLNRLNYLDEHFELKRKAIVESSMTQPVFSKLSQAGYHCSYYLPTHYANFSKTKKAKVAQEIASQIVLQKVNAVSFDVALYPFVKEHLEPLIANDFVYHVWDISIGFQNPDLISKLETATFYKDKRIKTILIKFKSEFEL